MKKEWTLEEIATGYEAMAELNLALAREFAALEDEAQKITDEQLMTNN